jgi:hypothetical protein
MTLDIHKLNTGNIEGPLVVDPKEFYENLDHRVKTSKSEEKAQV